MILRDRACEIGSSIKSGCYPGLKVNDFLSMKCRKVVDEHFKRVIMLLISPHLSTSSFDHYFQKKIISRNNHFCRENIMALLI